MEKPNQGGENTSNSVDSDTSIDFIVMIPHLSFYDQTNEILVNHGCLPESNDSIDMYSYTYNITNPLKISETNDEIKNQLEIIFSLVQRMHESGDLLPDGIKYIHTINNITNCYTITLVINGPEISIVKTDILGDIEIKIIYKQYKMCNYCDWMYILMKFQIVEKLKSLLNCRIIRISDAGHATVTIFPSNYPHVPPIIIPANNSLLCKPDVIGNYIKAVLTEDQVCIITNLLSNKRIAVSNNEFAPIEQALQEIMNNPILS